MQKKIDKNSKHQHVSCISYVAEESSASFSNQERFQQSVNKKVEMNQSRHEEFKERDINAVVNRSIVNSKHPQKDTKH